MGFEEMPCRLQEPLFMTSRFPGPPPHHVTMLSEVRGLTQVASTGLQLWVQLGSQTAIWLHTPDICAALSPPTPGDSLFPLPFHLTRIYLHQGWEGP